MTTAILGYASSGKTTVFNALTRSDAATGGYGASKSVNIGIGSKPDARLDLLETKFSARRKVRADMEFWDLPTDYSATEVFARETVNDLQRAKCILLVVRAFDDPAVPHPAGSVDWLRDLQQLHFDLVFADIELVARRMERIELGIKALKATDRDAAVRNIEALRQVQIRLEDGVPLGALDLSDAESRALSGVFTLSTLPIVVAVNIAESEIGSTTTQSVTEAAMSALGESAAGSEIAFVAICGTVEEELRQMDDTEARDMRESLYGGVDASEELMTACLAAQNVDTFYTASDKEVRAWHFPRGATASASAGVVHSDMERGFIRAEVVGFDAFAECGSMESAKKAGTLRQEGRDYIFQDGDIAHFLFSV